jgi:hypothetical protein
VTQPLNLYGDRLFPTTGRHGGNISSQRLDELDVQALRYALQLRNQQAAALDLGCGLGLQGLRFATLGLRSLLIDRLPVEQTVLGRTDLAALLPISYLQRDARHLTAADLPARLQLCYSQRFLHYLRFEEAVALLRLIRQRMEPGAKLFLSASGLDSELGTGYAGRSQPLAERWAPLSPELAARHRISEAVCLYRPEDLGKLAQTASFFPERVFSSPFGNVKGVFSAS